MQKGEANHESRTWVYQCDVSFVSLLYSNASASDAAQLLAKAKKPAAIRVTFAESYSGRAGRNDRRH
jgi:hypothetical protein